MSNRIALTLPAGSVVVNAIAMAAIDWTLEHEGGYVNDPVDPGGATNYGISLRWLKQAGELDLDGDALPDGDLDFDGDIDADDIRALTRPKAISLYYHHWWAPAGYDTFPGLIAAKTFDLAVNMGSRQGHKLLQRSLNRQDCGLVVDGLVGPKTRAALQRFHNDPEPIFVGICQEAEAFYLALIARRPAFSKYRRGWLRRAHGRPDLEGITAPPAWSAMIEVRNMSAGRDLEVVVRAFGRDEVAPLDASRTWVGSVGPDRQVHIRAREAA